MRFLRLGALVAWLAMASVAIAGFAAFSPARTPDIASATPESAAAVTVATTAPASDVGVAAGRVAAMTYVTSADPDGTRPVQPDRAAIAALAQASPAETASDAPATTAAPATTEAPATTIAPTTTEATTTVPTTEPPTTTTTEPPTTTTTEPPEESIYVPPGTEPWVGMIQASFAAADVERALMVVWCESNGDPNATNPSSGAAGLFQHLPKYWPERSEAAGWAGASIYDPAANIAVAAWLVYEGGGWSHWSPSAHCWG